MNVSEKLCALRRELGMSQAELAEKMDVSRQAVSGWETGKATPSVENLRCLGALYGVPLEYLLNEDAVQPAVVTAVPEEERQEIQRSRKHCPPWVRWIALGICALAAMIFIFFLMTGGRGKSRTPLDELPKKEVQFESNGSFDLDW